MRVCNRGLGWAPSGGAAARPAGKHAEQVGRMGATTSTAPGRAGALPNRTQHCCNVQPAPPRCCQAHTASASSLGLLPPEQGPYPAPCAHSRCTSQPQPARMKRLALGSAAIAAAAPPPPRAAALRPPLLPPTASALPRAAQHTNLVAPGHSLQLSSVASPQRPLSGSPQVGPRAQGPVTHLCCCCPLRSCQLLSSPVRCMHSTFSLLAFKVAIPAPTVCRCLQARRQRQRLATHATGGPDVLASRDEPVAVHRSKDEEDQMLRSLDRVEVCQFGTACGWVGVWVCGEHLGSVGARPRPPLSAVNLPTRRRDYGG